MYINPYIHIVIQLHTCIAKYTAKQMVQSKVLLQITDVQTMEMEEKYARDACYPHPREAELFNFGF